MKMCRSLLPIVLCSILLAPITSSNAATIYLCKSYSGGSFWASDSCANHKGLIDRIVSVPDNMPFDQQVAIGEADRQNAQNLVNQQAQNTNTTTTTTTVTTTVNCDAISKEISSLDSMARQPQSASTQDWISQKKKSLRDTQFRNHCR